MTNGALGLLPLSLLPTATRRDQVDAEPPFADYRNVAWLAKTHAVTMVPSASALRTLRGLPVASAKREQFIGFGDPFFNAKQAAETQKSSTLASGRRMATRGPAAHPPRRRAGGVDSAELGLLPRLPDTAEELTSIALALEADPSKVLHLGKARMRRRSRSPTCPATRLSPSQRTASCRASSTA